MRDLQLSRGEIEAHQRRLWRWDSLQIALGMERPKTLKERSIRAGYNPKGVDNITSKALKKCRTAITNL